MTKLFLCLVACAVVLCLLDAPAFADPKTRLDSQVSIQTSLNWDGPVTDFVGEADRMYIVLYVDEGQSVMDLMFRAGTSSEVYFDVPVEVRGFTVCGAEYFSDRPINQVGNLHGYVPLGYWTVKTPSGRIRAAVETGGEGKQLVSLIAPGMTNRSDGWFGTRRPTGERLAQFEEASQATMTIGALCNPTHLDESVSFRLEYTLSGVYTADVYDVAGRHVQRLLYDQLEGGGGAVTMVWDGRDKRGTLLPAGTYYLSARLGTFQATTKIVRTY